eukprot:4787299-Pyramimonas_sp.AAC.1
MHRSSPSSLPLATHVVSWILPFAPKSSRAVFLPPCLRRSCCRPVCEAEESGEGFCGHSRGAPSEEQQSRSTRVEEPRSLLCQAHLRVDGRVLGEDGDGELGKVLLLVGGHPGHGLQLDESAAALAVVL